jgi:hypothetical protein
MEDGFSLVKSQEIEHKATDMVRDLEDRSGKRPSEII